MKSAFEEKIERLSPWVYLLLVFVGVLYTTFLLAVVIHQQHAINNSTRAIQDQRRELIYGNCQDQNERNARAVKVLNRLLIKSGVSKKRREASRGTTILFINALAPVKNCTQVTLKATGKGEH